MRTTLQARIDDNHLRKLESIKAQTGLNTSFLIRQMIDAAVIQPAKFTVILSTKANSDTTLAGNGVAVRA